jgi:hypothetical protein
MGSRFALNRRSLISASRGEEHIASSEDATALSFSVLHSDMSTMADKSGELQLELDVDMVEEFNGEQVTIGGRGWAGGGRRRGSEDAESSDGMTGCNGKAARQESSDEDDDEIAVAGGRR